MSINLTAMKVTKTIEIDIPGLGGKIEQARKESRLPLTEICKKVNMSTMNWYRIEKEQQTIPIDTLRRIEKVLNVNLGVDFNLPIAI